MYGIIPLYITKVGLDQTTEAFSDNNHRDYARKLWQQGAKGR